MSLRHGLRSFSARRRRTVSRDKPSCSVSLTIAPASNSRVQRARPSGGLEQAVATSSASSLPDSLRSAPGRGSSLSAASRLPSTKRRLVRYTVDPPTATLIAMSSSLAPASAANRICARLSLRAACLPPLSSAVSCVALGSGSVRPGNVHSSLHPPGVEGITDESDARAFVSPPRAPSFTPKQGQYLAFIHAYTLVLGRPPAEADLQRLFRVTPAFSPPDGAHARTRRTDPAPARRRPQHPAARRPASPATPKPSTTTRQILCAEVLAPEGRPARDAGAAGARVLAAGLRPPQFRSRALRAAPRDRPPELVRRPGPVSAPRPYARDRGRTRSHRHERRDTARRSVGSAS